MKWIVAATHSLSSTIRVSAFHLARYLSQHGHEVLYLPAPISPLHYLMRNDDPRFLERKGLWGRKPIRYDAHIRQYTPMTMLPALHGVPFNTLGVLKASLGATMPSLRGIMRRAGFENPDVMVINNLQYAWLDELAKPRCLIYRCADDIQGFGNAPRSLIEAELILLKRADLVLAAADDVAEKLRQRGAHEVHVFRNAADLSAYEEGDALAIPDDLRAIHSPRILYVGSVNERFNVPWVEAAARALPDSQFIIIGTVSISIDELTSIPNVHLLGPRKAEEIPGYMAHCDAAIIPFVQSDLVNSTCPIKLYEYLAAGLPVVASRWKELEGIGAPATLVGDEKEFIEAVRNAPGYPGREERRAFAKGESWAVRFQALECLVQEALAREA